MKSIQSTSTTEALKMAASMDMDLSLAASRRLVMQVVRLPSTIIMVLDMVWALLELVSTEASIN